MIAERNRVRMQSQPLGKHSYFIEQDTYFLILGGPLELEDAVAMHATMAEMLKVYGRLFVIIDGRFPGSGTSPSPATRRFLAEWNRQHHASGVACFGDSGRRGSVFTAMIFAAIRLFRRSPLPLVFVKDEATARSWVASERAKLTSDGSPPSSAPSG
jgi:hypothetical protein